MAHTLTVWTVLAVLLLTATAQNSKYNMCAWSHNILHL